MAVLHIHIVSVSFLSVGNAKLKQMNIHEEFLSKLIKLRDDVRNDIQQLDKEKMRHKIDLNNIAIDSYKKLQLFGENNGDIISLELENDRLYRALANER